MSAETAQPTTPPPDPGPGKPPPLLELVPQAPKKPLDQAKRVFEHWCKVMGKNPKTLFDPKRRAAVERQLKAGRTVEDLCRAVDGCKLDPFSMGANDRGTKFNDLTLICRDAEHVEKFMALAESPPGQGPPKLPGSQQGKARAQQRFAQTQELLKDLRNPKSEPPDA